MPVGVGGRRGDGRGGHLVRGVEGQTERSGDGLGGQHETRRAGARDDDIGTCQFVGDRGHLHGVSGHARTAGLAQDLDEPVGTGPGPVGDDDLGDTGTGQGGGGQRGHQ